MDAGIISIIGIILGLIVMIVLAYKGVSLLICTPIASIVVAVFSMENPVSMLVGPYMQKFAEFAQNYFLLFMFSAMFGALMGATGAAKGIADAILKLVNKAPSNKRKFWSIIFMTLLNFVLAYGGINGFVIIYTTNAIGRELSKSLDVPWHLCMLTSVASAVWVQGFMPGAPSIQNLIPMDYLGTTPTAGPLLGIICSLIALVLWLIYVKYCFRKADREHEGFLPTGAEIDKVSFDIMSEKAPGIIKSLIPSIVLLVTLNVINLQPVTSLIVAGIVAVIIFWKELGGLGALKKVLAEGANNSVSAVVATCACTGFGGVVAAVSGYQTILSALTNLPGPPIFQFFLAVSIAAGATGSGSGGLTIALNSLGDQFLAMGINPQLMHRIGSIACCSLDTLPHNGSIVNSLMVARLTHKQAYKHIFVISVVITTVCGLIACVLGSMGIV